MNEKNTMNYSGDISSMVSSDSNLNKVVQQDDFISDIKRKCDRKKKPKK